MGEEERGVYPNNTYHKEDMERAYRDGKEDGYEQRGREEVARRQDSESIWRQGAAWGFIESARLILEKVNEKPG